MTAASRLGELALRHSLPTSTVEALGRVLVALARERDPHTTVSEPGEAVDIHVADSLVALELPEVRPALAVADIGSGAGFPGLPLALALPRAGVDLIESARRKCAVIERLIDSAAAANVRARAVRAEEWAAGEGGGRHDLVTARAVGPLPVVLEYAAPLLREGGAVVIWRGGRRPEEEQRADRAAEQLGLGAGRLVPVRPFPAARDRHLAIFVKERPTPARFPRRPGRAAKAPLA